MNIVDVVGFFPDEKIGNISTKSNFDDVVSPEFSDTSNMTRRFASPRYSSVQLGKLAVDKIFEKNDINREDIDLILNFSVYSDNVLPGDAMEIARMSGLKNAEAINIEDGCCSYMTMLNLARLYISAGLKHKILITTVTNFISRLEQFKKEKISQILGDGATATLIDDTGDNDFIVQYNTMCNKDFSGLFKFNPDDGLGFWQKGSGEVSTSFDKNQFNAIKKMIKALPELVQKTITDSGLAHNEIDYVITHQPNKNFLSLWVKKMNMEDIAVDTFDDYGNLFHSNIPASLSKLYEEKKVGENTKNVAITAFSYAGEKYGAMIIKV